MQIHHPGGRPCKLTPELQKRLCDAIAAGNYYEAACGYADLNYSTFLKWMRKGKKAKRGMFFQFRRAIKKAESDAEVRIVAQWQGHMPENYQACRDFLARRHPKRWGPKDAVQLTGKDGEAIKHEHTGKDGGPISYESLRKLPADELNRLYGEALGPPRESER